MRYLLIAIGTRGDVEPFLAAGQILEAQGHQVHCLFPAQFQELTQSTGLDFSPLDRRFLELIESEAGRSIMGQKGSKFKRIKQLYKIAKSSWALQKTLVNEQQNAIDTLKPDRIIYHPKAVAGRIWGMANRNRSWILSPVPNMLHASSDYPHIGINRNLGKWGNRMSYKLTTYLSAKMTNSMANEVASRYPNTRFSVRHFVRYSLDDEQVIYPISPTLFSPPKEWPDRAKITGYLERNKASKWETPTEVTDFLLRQSQEGRSIVFITFGSMVNAKPLQNTQLIIDALSATNYAAIINTSSGGLVKLDTDNSNILFTESIPYDYIFPKVRAVIHHGGSGTTHRAIKHACASMILPHIIDQFFWNRQIASLGVGPLGVKISKLSSKNFAALLHQLMENESYHLKAAQVSKKMQTENAEACFLSAIA